MNRIPLLAVVVVVACAGDSVLTGVRSDGVTIICNTGEDYYQCGPEAPPPTTNGGDGNTSGGGTGTTTGTPPSGGGDTGTGSGSSTGSDTGSGAGSGSDTGSGGTGSGGTGSGCGENYSGTCGGSGGSGGGGGGGGGGGSGSCQPWPNGPATILWPPNHKLHTYSLDDCAGINMCPNGQPGALDGTITKITVDEAIDVGKGGDGHTTNYDARIIDATHFELRSERQGGADGRVYTVYYTDASGNAGSCQFLVPHNKGPFEGAVDSGTVVTVLP